MATWLRFLPLTVPAVLWLWLFSHLRDEWTVNAQYNYGWAVPFLAAFTFFLRWKSRPSPALEWARSRETPAFISSVLLLAILLPVRVIAEANRDWRMLSWVLALIVVGYSLTFLWRLGGRPWLTHFAFPVCFPLVAVPWLAQPENIIVQTLARAVAAVAVEIAGWIGIGAYQQGNVIELPNGFVGVDDACSGVKTLQAAIMVTLFLGELQRLAPRQRAFLVVAGSAWVFLCNVLRATTLVILAARRGTAAIAEWHDLIGTIVLIAGMVGLVALSWWLGRKSTFVSGDQTPSGGLPEIPRRSVALKACLALVWLTIVFGSTELWYRAHEGNLVQQPSWQAEWPAEERSFRRPPIPDSTRAILRYDEASTATWESPRGIVWWGFFARWKPERVALQLVRSHSPEICLPAIGRTFERELSPFNFNDENLALGFRAYQFSQNDRPLFVFVAIQDDRKPQGKSADPLQWNSRGRLLAAWEGRRNLGQRLLEIAVIGFDDYFRAREEVLRTVREIVHQGPVRD